MFIKWHPGESSGGGGGAIWGLFVDLSICRSGARCRATSAVISVAFDVRRTGVTVALPGLLRSTREEEKGPFNYFEINLHLDAGDGGGWGRKGKQKYVSGAEENRKTAVMCNDI